MPVRHPPKVLLVGWDAADWKLIRPLVAEGKLPALASLLQDGVHGNLATLWPVLSPMLWTSIATGQRPHKHGIHGFTEPTPDGLAVRPVTVLSRKVKAVWNILNQSGHRCNVVGWWPSSPAEPLNGAMISNHYHRAEGGPDEPWPVSPGTVHPAALAAELAPLRLHPAELGEEHLLPFVPRAAEIDQARDRRLQILARTIAECTNVHAAATFLLQQHPADFTAVYYDAIDHFGHAFMRYHPPRLPWIAEKDFELFKDVMEGAYRYHDLMLGVLLDMVGPECTVILMSDHGFHSDHLRQATIPIEPAGRAEEHRTHGIFVIRGPGIKRGQRLAGATVLDLAPTVLHLFGLPAGSDLDGRVLVEAFVDPREPQVIPTWETRSGPFPDGRHSPQTPIDRRDHESALAQLVALGYIDPPPADAVQAVQASRDELHYNLARSYMDAGLYLRAIPLFEDLWERRTDEARHGLLLARCLLTLGRTGPAEETLEKVIQRKHAISATAQAEIRRLEAEGFNPEAEPDPEQREAGLARLRFLQARAGVNETAVHLIRANLKLSAGDPQAALAEMQRIAPDQLVQHPGFFLLLGRIYFALKRFDAALQAFDQTAKIDPEQAEAHYGLARVHLARRRHSRGLEAALTAIELNPFFPAAHFLLATALLRVNQTGLAVAALRACLRQNPNHVLAHTRLAKLLTRLGKNEEAVQHLALARESRARIRRWRTSRGLPLPPPLKESEQHPVSNDGPAKLPLTKPASATNELSREVITVVSGLPRSGTSLVMQLLAAGGLPVFSDGTRAADVSNPRGYFEHEKVKGLVRDASWLGSVRGQTVKIIAPLLHHLPLEHTYRVVYVRRDLDEVLASQTALLARQGLEPVDESAVRRAFLHQEAAALALLARHPQISSLVVYYAGLLANPVESIAELNAFFGGDLNVARMIQAVDPTLYRQRRANARP